MVSAMPSPPLDSRLLRVLPVLGAASAFVAAAMLVQPDWSRADPGVAVPAADAGLAPAPATVPEASRPAVSELLPGASIGRLETPGRVIEIRATPDGPRYHVLGPDGRPHDVGLTAEQLASRFPDLDLRDATAHPSGAGPALLMLADPDHAWDR
jgi:hypothetical protein